MSTELAQNDTDSEISVLPASRPTAPLALGQLLQHAEAMSSAKELAEVMCASELVPQLYRGKPGNGTVAILYGAELGLNPIQSLQQIFVVHGMPAVYARTMVALLKSHGYLIRCTESTDESVTVWGQDPRSGVEEVSTWTLARARKAGYTSNKKYETDPQGMLYAKAATEVCRKLAPEVLLGIAYSREELELDEFADGQQPKRVQSARGTGGLAAALGVGQGEPKVIEHEQKPAAAETTADAAPPTNATNRKMHALFREAGLDNDRRTERLTVVSRIIRRDIASGSEMSEAEAESVISTLQELKDAEVLRESVERLLAEAADNNEKG